MEKILFICALAPAILTAPQDAGATLVGVSSPAAIYADTSASTYIAAGNCSAKANSIAASYAGAQILSVERNGNSCIIVIRVNGTNGNPPRIITKTVSG